MLLFSFLPAPAQFNEELEKKILASDETYNLNAIDKKDALVVLEKILPDRGRLEERKTLVGGPWKYSHTVSAKGRKYRQSNAIYIYQFDENGNATFFQKGGGVKTFCTWENDRSILLEIDRFESSDRKERTRRDYLGVYFISENRLVLTKVVKSKEFSEKSAILFTVYFRS